MAENNHETRFDEILNTSCRLVASLTPDPGRGGYASDKANSAEYFVSNP
jgi:hypothetical protein